MSSTCCDVFKKEKEATYTVIKKRNLINGIPDTLLTVFHLHSFKKEANRGEELDNPYEAIKQNITSDRFLTQVLFGTIMLQSVEIYQK